MKLSNLRIETGNGKAKLVADVDSPFYQYKTLFYEVPEEYKSWLSDDVYDAFIIALIYPCMKHKDDIIVDGAISERLYRNLKNYAMKCIKDFSIELSMIDISASKLKVPEKRYHYVGAGFSGGVDSFSSIYDRFEKETDPKYKISALLCFNAGSHGDYDDSNTENKFYTRYKYLSSYPKEVGLPYIPENTNVHAYMDEGHQQSGITRHISCVLALQAAFDRYYYASSLSYFEEKYFGRDQFEFDLSEFCEPHFLAWISTESIELVSEGGGNISEARKRKI